MDNDVAEFVVLSGFLGSGKTTLLSDFLSELADDSTAVIVNDIGNVNIDGAILAAHDGVPMATLSNGCVCCSLINDLQFTIESLIDVRRTSGKSAFSRIVLECSGLSEPGAVMRSLSALSALRMRVRLVTTYAVNAQVDSDAFPLCAAQLCGAHTVVLTKLDLCDSAQIAIAERYVRSIAPMARVIVESDRVSRAKHAFALRGAINGSLGSASGVAADLSSTTTKHPRVQTFTFTWREALVWQSYADWMENLAGYLEGRLLRVKGILSVCDCEDGVLVQGVGQHFDTPRRVNGNEGASVIVIIAVDSDLGDVMSVKMELPAPEVTMLNAPASTGKGRFRGFAVAKS